MKRTRPHRIVVRISPAALALIAVLAPAQPGNAEVRSGVLLPDGQEFVSWEVPFQFTKTYYVDNRNSKASDQNHGTKEAPFLTIGKAAAVLQPGERVEIREGVYRERVTPPRGGTGPEKIISYEAAPGAKVVVSGARPVKTGWEPSTGFKLASRGAPPPAKTAKIYQLDLEPLQLGGYNPFAIANVMMDRRFLEWRRDAWRTQLLRRGLVLVDGRRIEQVPLYADMGQKDGTYWSEHNGLTLHVRLPGDADPSAHDVELVTQEQVFAPKKPYLGYVRVKGLTLECGASGFPIPQRGLVSTTCGHHWIIEDCVIRHANSVGLDIGYQDWNAEDPPQIGYTIVRRNHLDDIGVCGLAGLQATHCLVDSNLIENVGWQDAEMAWESGGVKIHRAVGTLLSNNVVRHLVHSPGLWLDSGNANCRITGNIVADTAEALRGGIYLEISRAGNMLDQNIVWKVTKGKGGSSVSPIDEGGWGIVIDGTDETVVAHNLVAFCDEAALKTRTAAHRGRTAISNQVFNNIFYQCAKCIDFAHKDNAAEGNLYVRAEREGGQPLNFIATPEALRLGLPTWQKYFGFDKRGGFADLSFDLDPDALTLKCSAAGEVPDAQTGQHFRRDLLGQPAGSARKAGPLQQIPTAARTFSIDPRQKGN
jgi:hypothetical protein